MTSPSFPGALDALANPGPTTETDDTGFELDIVVARLQNIAMAIEAKLGIGTGGPPSTAAVLRRTATGTSGWGQIVAGDLAANSATQLTSAPSLATAQTNSTTPVTLWDLTVVTQGGPLLAIIAGSAVNGALAAVTSFSISVDGAANIGLSSFHEPVATYQSTFAGVLPITGVAAGTHHVVLKWSASANTTQIAVGWYAVIEFVR